MDIANNREYNQTTLSQDNFIKHITKKINEVSSSNSFNISDIIREYIGGKFIRSKFGYIFHKISKYDIDKCISIATSVELIHTASLLHDDVIDNNSTRRGIESAPAKWGNSDAILAGNYAMLNAFSILSSIDIKLVQIAIKSIDDLIIGEAMQKMHKCNYNIKDDEYLKINKLKTGSLFGMIAKSMFAYDEDISNSAYELGCYFGILFQIRDDIYDCLESSKITGKDEFNDIYEQKATAPIYITYKYNKKFEKIIDQLNSSSDPLSIKINSSEIKEMIKSQSKDILDMTNNILDKIKKSSNDFENSILNNKEIYDSICSQELSNVKKEIISLASDCYQGCISKF